MTPVSVRWLDHVGLGASWQAVNDAVKAKVETFTTVGYLLASKRDAITIGGTLDDAQETTGDVTVIVRKAIVSIKPLVEEDDVSH